MNKNGWHNNTYLPSFLLLLIMHTAVPRAVGTSSGRNTPVPFGSMSCQNEVLFRNLCIPHEYDAMDDFIKAPSIYNYYDGESL